MHYLVHCFCTGIVWRYNNNNKETNKILTYIDKISSPQGHIPLCMSENKLIIELIGVRLMQIETASRAFSDSTVYCYNNTLGLPGPREAVAYFLGKLLVV